MVGQRLVGQRLVGQMLVGAALTPHILPGAVEKHLFLLVFLCCFLW